jgi:hypothetical protein
MKMNRTAIFCCRYALFEFYFISWRRMDFDIQQYLDYVRTYTTVYSNYIFIFAYTLISFILVVLI